MKKFTLGGLLIAALVLGSVLVLGIVGTANAQGNAPGDTTPKPQPWSDHHRGKMGDENGFSGRGLMNDYVKAALAEKLGISAVDLDKYIADGKTFREIAQDKGLTPEEATQMLKDARSAALDKMVAEGVITQTQAGRMKQQAGKMMEGGRPGGCQNRDGAPFNHMRGRGSGGI